MDNISSIDNADAFAYSGERPWHSKGIKVPGLMTVKEAMVAGRADWEVTKEPIMLADFNMVMIDGHYATVRNGHEVDGHGDLIKTPLGVVGERYTVVQNEDAFGFFDKVIDDGVACIETVGCIGKGETVFAMAKVPDIFEPVKGDPVERYILLTTSHDGSSPIQAIFTPIRVVCQNTLNAALRTSKAKHKNIIKIRHTKNAELRLKEAVRLVKLENAYWGGLKDAYKALAMRDMTRLDVMDFVNTMFPGKMVTVNVNGQQKSEEAVSTRTQNIRNQVLDLFEGEAIGSELAPGSAWQAYNAITEYVDYKRSTRKTTDQWEASMFSKQAIDLRQNAFDYLVGLVSA